MTSKRALITGITGQDGSYLAEFLLAKGYEVHGLVQQAELETPERGLARIHAVFDQVTLHPVSLENHEGLLQMAQNIQPDECYHLAAASFVSSVPGEEASSLQTNINGTHAMLSVVHHGASACRFFFAASCEMFSRAFCSPQDETTPLHPRSVYGVTKAAGFLMTRHYREDKGLFACSGILYNHESERRGVEFVTRKITSTVARIKLGQASEIRLGNLDAKRDWGYAPDYVDAMWRMLQQEQADDFVIATGEPHSVREFAQAAFAEVGLNWQDYVVVDPRYYRPAEEFTLTGDASKARAALGWSPQVHFEELVHHMVQNDLALLMRQRES